MSFCDSLDCTERKKIRAGRVAEGVLLRLMGQCLHVGGLDGEAVGVGNLPAYAPAVGCRGVPARTPGSPAALPPHHSLVPSLALSGMQSHGSGGAYPVPALLPV